MKRLILITFLIALLFSIGVAQESGETLASTLEVFVFPSAGQAADQQSKDESECYSWAASNTGSDPFELQKQSEQQAQQTEQQVAQAKSATQGAVAGRRRSRAASQQAQQQAQQQAAAQQQATAEQVDNFKKAFSVCLEANDYMVKY